MSIIEFQNLLRSISVEEKEKLIFSCVSPVSFRDNEVLYLPNFEPENYELYVVIGDQAIGPCENRIRIRVNSSRYEKYADRILNRGTNARLFIAQKRPRTYNSDSFLTYSSPTIEVENSLSINVNFDLKLTVDFCLEPSMIKSAINAYHDSVFSSANVYFLAKLQNAVKAITDLHFESFQNGFNQIRDRKSLIGFIDHIEQSSKNLQERIELDLKSNEELKFFKINFINVVLYCREKAAVTESSNTIPQMDTEHDIEVARIRNQIEEEELAQIGQIQYDKRAHDAILQMGNDDLLQSIIHDNELNAATLQRENDNFVQRMQHERILFMEAAKQRFITISLERYDKCINHMSNAADQTRGLLEKIIEENPGVRINFNELIPQIRSLFDYKFPDRQELEDEMNMMITKFDNYYSGKK